MKSFSEFNCVADQVELHTEEQVLTLERRDFIDIITAFFGKHINAKNYELALKALSDVVKRKRVAGELRHDIYYYAQRVSGSFEGVEGRELAELYLSKAAVKESEVGVTTAAVAAPDSPFKVSRVAGCDCIEVDADTYMRCKFGKRPYAKWSGYVEDEGLRTFVQKHYKKSKSLLITNKDTGVSTYLRR